MYEGPPVSTAKEANRAESSLGSAMVVKLPEPMLLE